MAGANKVPMSVIRVEVAVPSPEASSSAPSIPRKSVEDKVHEALELIESGHESYTEWRMINKLYAELQKRRNNPRAANLIRMIEPILRKYGYSGVAAVEGK